MAVALQTTGGGVFTASGSTTATVSSITQDAACNRVFICVQTEGTDTAGAGQTTTNMTCTYGGVSATFVGTFKTTETVQVRSTLFQILAANLPAAGSGKSCTVSFTGASASISIGVVLLTGCSQAALDGVNISGTDVDGDISQNVTVAEANSAVLFFGTSNGTGTVTGNRTTLYDHVGVASTTTYRGQIQLAAGIGAQSQTMDFATNPARSAWSGFAVRQLSGASLPIGQATFTAGVATASTTALRAQGVLSATFAAGVATVTAVASRGRAALASFASGPASATTSATVAGNRSIGPATFSSGPATASASATRSRLASLATFSSGLATASASAVAAKVISLATFVSGLASASTSSAVAVPVGRHPSGVLKSVVRASGKNATDLTSSGRIRLGPKASGITSTRARATGRSKITTWQPPTS